MKEGIGRIAWAVLALVGAFCLGTVALRRGEPINALWIGGRGVQLLVAYRFYARFSPTACRADASRASGEPKTRLNTCPPTSTCCSDTLRALAVPAPW